MGKLCNGWIAQFRRSPNDGLMMMDEDPLQVEPILSCLNLLAIFSLATGRQRLRRAAAAFSRLHLPQRTTCYLQSTLAGQTGQVMVVSFSLNPEVQYLSKAMFGLQPTIDGRGLKPKRRTESAFPHSNP